MRTLKKGTKGEGVTELQKNLKALGYTIGIDGVFGTETENVVKLFQRNNNLSPDGIVGTNTWTAMQDFLDDTPVEGIDVSHHNGVINWNNVSDQRVSFVFCKASQGKYYKDEMLHTNMNELKRLSYIRGAYHFFTFKDVSAEEQADNFLNTGIDFSQAGTLPPVLDVEWQQSSSLNQYIIDNRSVCVKKIADWLAIVESKTGRNPIIYTNKFFWKDYLGNPAGFERYGLWVASYRPDAPMLPDTWNNYMFWQYTESGTVAGITGNIDKNIFNGSKKALNKLALM